MAMEWMATITGDHLGYPGFQDLGNFSPRRKNFWEQKSACLLASNFAVESQLIYCDQISEKNFAKFWAKVAKTVA